MVALEGNNGDTISCIVLIIDSLARENESMVTIETLHEEGCHIFETIKDSNRVVYKRDEELKRIDRSVADEALAHLYFCNCDANIEAVFTKGDGASLLVSVTLSDMKDVHPWLNDEKITKDMLEQAKEAGDDSPLIRTLKPVFKKRVGTNLGITFDTSDMTIN